ncbi:hypothetical protein T4B_7070 [Trichinella pseudospiralis]|uniref:Uncharacterized protein n=1 Tax=Trichinella pseudospiralis TaxID=6337 RepID=A0A0V1GB06_TRIPS|nr:hypothetical protein T4B_7070 [Trichinella pseudospiralis]
MQDFYKVSHSYGHLNWFFVFTPYLCKKNGF